MGDRNKEVEATFSVLRQVTVQIRETGHGKNGFCNVRKNVIKCGVHSVGGFSPSGGEQEALRQFRGGRASHLAVSTRQAAAGAVQSEGCRGRMRSIWH